MTGSLELAGSCRRSRRRPAGRRRPRSPRPRQLQHPRSCPCVIEPPQSLRDPSHEKRQPGRGVLLVSEGPVLPGAVHGTRCVPSFIVRLSGDDLHHLAEAGIAMHEGEAAKHVYHVKDVVPDERILELAEVSADAEQVHLPLLLSLPVPSSISAAVRVAGLSSRSPVRARAFSA